MRDTTLPEKPCFIQLLLAKVLNGKQINSLQFFSYSGFIFSIRDVWCWATAGHVMEQLDTHLKNKTISVKNYGLIDSFGNNVKSYQPIPFLYESAPKFYIHDKDSGLDFGLVALSQYYRNLLETNGIVPVKEENWINQHKVEFERYIILGLPDIFIETTKPLNNNEEIVATLSPTIIFLSRPENVPDDLPKTRFPRFVGKIKDDFPLDDIRGMSGGPVFGFNKNFDRYWIVAVQSSKLNSSDLNRNKLVFACSIPVFAKLVEEMLSTLDQDNL